MNDFDNVEILLVEDNDNDAGLTIRALRKCNFTNKLFRVKDGVEALEFIRSTGDFTERDPQDLIKIVLLDLKMPRLGGIDVIRELKSDGRTSSIPIVVMTSSNQDRDVVESYRLGVNGFVTKPVQAASFMTTLAQIGAYWLTVNQVPVR